MGLVANTDSMQARGFSQSLSSHRQAGKTMALLKRHCTTADEHNHLTYTNAYGMYII